MRAASVLAAASLALLLTSCTSPLDATPATPSSTAAPAGVTVALEQLRSDVAGRQAQVMVTNGTGSVLTVGELHVDDPRFAEQAERVHHRDSRIQPGTSVAITIQLPPAACPAPDDAPATVTFDWSLEDGSGTASADLPDTLSFVPALHERECRAAALAAAADVSFSSFTPSPPGEPADLTLTVVPTGKASAALDAMHATNLLTFAGDDVETFPLGVAIAEGDTDTVEVHVPIEPLRCDPHAVQEDKRGTVFTLDVDVDGAPGQIELAASEDMRGAILTWVGAWCGFGS
ncbi:hypothetical protein AAIB33_14770 [Microbacterium sp. AZCO]|uniref:hypothetical protein n=1 Tax=Microbacterium sp. AZCO TaxID=3142976 RepID=UPI0031F41325